jgi:hypothetical protein
MKAYHDNQKEEDVLLNVISNSLTDLKEKSVNINSEIETHIAMLEETENEVDNATENTVYNTSRIRNLIGKEHCGKIFCIVSLFCIMIALFILVLSMQ